MSDEQKSNLNREELIKGFRTSAIAGASFGLVAGAAISWLGTVDYPTMVLVPGMTLLLGIIAGTVGLVGAYLEQYLLVRGIKEDAHRNVLTFVVVATMVTGISFVASIIIGEGHIVEEMRRLALPGLILGIIFGGTVSYVNYRFEKDRQQVQTLEMENRYLAELAEKNQLLEEAGRNLAVAEAQNRMARELHDSISQGIHGIVFSLHSLRRMVGKEGQEAEIINHLEETTQATMKELRRLIMELTPSPLEEQGLVEALELHADLFARRQQLAVDVSLEYNGGLTPEQEVAVYRIVQEALANVQKHAGAHRVDVSLAQDGDVVILRVRDNGHGFNVDMAGQGQGLKNMSARARHGGGRLSIDSRPGEGTLVEAVFPLEQNLA
ncbi:sensor histidine kinase [Dethiobacter alkaliphilus]|uniref:histidine kinase n=1 Tax=Dethiobacter alkaliphilus AHT 1 TaxID=555088 RepID=C0GIE2_DETAL|nr:sensor histidine kinase [Dethiobacter alkaliphilus]EEG76803.1 integral membrane sensor signal transduction histidine kinase [Dethiobacter alkaliphilus AHT 1]